MRLFAVLEKLFVQLVEVAFRRLLVRKYLDDLLPLHHFFHEALFHGQRTLLRDHEFGACAADFFDDGHHDCRTGKDDQRQPDTVKEHHRDGRNQRHHARYHRGDTLSHQLAERVGIVGIGTHDIAVRVRVEIFDGQAFHLIEHIRTETVKHALGHARHDLRIGHGSDQPHQIKHAHGINQGNQLAFYRSEFVGALHAGDNDAVHQLFGEHRRNNARHRA